MHTGSTELMDYCLGKIPERLFGCADIGSQDVNGSYRHTIERRNIKYHGYDIAEGENVDFVFDPEDDSWPYRIMDYDLVISGQCMEHVPMPWRWLKQLKKLMHDKSWIIIVAPYHCQPHFYPIDCFRFLPHGMAGLFEEAGIFLNLSGFIYHEAGPGDCFAIGTLDESKMSPFEKPEKDFILGQPIRYCD